jgi:hypothetical protein
MRWVLVGEVRERVAGQLPEFGSARFGALTRLQVDDKPDEEEIGVSTTRQCTTRERWI